MSKKIYMLCVLLCSIMVTRAQIFNTENVTYIYGEPLKQYAIVVETIEVGSNASEMNKNRKSADRSAYMLGKKYKLSSTLVKSNEKNVFRVLLATSDDLEYVSQAQKKVSVKMGNTYIIKLGSEKQEPKAMTSNKVIVKDTKNETVPKKISDVDIDIPVASISDETKFAVIIANEDYQEEAKVDYAINDGEVFKQYCNKALGIPESNIHIRKNATLNNMRMEMDWIKKVAHAYDGQAQIIFYYAGHGIPDEKTGAGYLLPIDGSGSSLSTGYSLTNLYAFLGELPAKSITVFIDACFSGTKRGEGMLSSARGVAIKVKTEAPKGKMVVFSAAQGNETAYPYAEKEHGLFTYYLLKKLKDTKGNVTYGELGSYITEQVSRKSIVYNGKSQSPTVTPSNNMSATWKDMKLK